MFGDRIGYGRSERAPFASDPWASRGRRYEEAASPTRTAFQRDRDRIIHSTAFRRLREKTQVFLVDEGDHYRTRLTHTIEVTQIARALARALRLDEDLAEALALAHDLGHTPFGHAGERALDAAMKQYGGFDHNAQSLRVVTRLERSYPGFDGLNLTWETLEGLAKHNGPLQAPGRDPAGLPFAVAEYAAVQDLHLATHAGAEAQAAAIADDIAYDAHDIDDGLRSGYLTLAAIAGVPLVGELLAAIAREYPGLAPERTRHELVRRLITRMIEDVIGESLARLDRVRPSSADDVRAAGGPLIGFSPAMDAADRAIKAVLGQSVYRHAEIMVAMGNAEALLRRLFDRYLRDPAAMPAEWRPPGSAGVPERARRVADFVAGMTDRYALAEHERLFGTPAELRWPAPRAAE
ncbi:MAG TPA: deoxyguanosinetriphosphate triphosphohydrolase [Bauldia sp.]|nr:deoxyguanosinetriphosphate triphosphohydrolase [Bauldia sp.]